MARNNTLEVPLSKEEKDKIENKAKMLGLPAATYLRLIGLNSSIEINSKLS